MNTVCIVDLNNRQEDYVRCLEFVRAIEDKDVSNREEKLTEAIKKLNIYLKEIPTQISPKYMEEPILYTKRAKKLNAFVEKQYSFSQQDKETLLRQKLNLTHAYIEVLSYNKIINEAEKRNRILFDKLGL